MPAPAPTPVRAQNHAHLSGRMLALVQSAAPANFGMVMGTGIVSIALHLLGLQSGALALFYVNMGMFCCLWAVYLLRLGLYPAEFFGDMGKHARGPGYLTTVAGTGLLANQFALLWGRYDVACGLFWLALVLWAFFIWMDFLRIFTATEKPPLEKGINGAWLLNTVSCQALVILGCVVMDHAGWDRETAFFLLTALFGAGFMLYVVVITLIIYRLCYSPVPPEALDPTFWVCAGAVAITTLAGSELVLRAEQSAFLQSVLPFLKGMTVMAWGFAAWWVVLLCVLGLWRHGVRRYPFIYTPGYWSMVFPMGMFTACTIMCGRAMGMDSLMVVPRVFIAVAVASWLATFWGMGRFLWRSLAAPPERQPQ